MKKIISALLLLIFCLSFFAFTVKAEENIGLLKADRVTAKAGDSVTIPVSLVDHKGVCVIGITVKYDSKALELKKVVHSAEDVFSYTVNAKTEGEVFVLMDGKNLENITGDIKLFELKFKVKDNADPGRTLVRVLCDDGMATYLQNSENEIVPTSFLPATSTGSVTVLCVQHDFSEVKTNGVFQCSKCGAVKNDEGNVSVDSSQGFPEIDVSSEVPDDAASNEMANESNNSSKPNGDNKDGTNGLKFVYFIPIIAALVIIGGVLVIKFKKGNKE